jgi:hypothetical protein
MNSTAGRALWSAIRTSAFSVECRMAPIIPIAWSRRGAGEHLIEEASRFKGYSESLPAIGSKIDVDPRIAAGNCVYGRKHVPWISFASIPNGANG